ncbi:LamG-like jellyroll fold domain-containing protein [Thalassoroseus pseudoceratinae]|uniref:LamG-like jellyroll fold domain-containing protein n=1 Tax=Thalassoroseus pseudoceratinae TaxID=2713176 RepID=UPI00141FC9E5|nr:LamG-like jellyroll fold domain-containing protein [Thalassoroseus pseudoceratinae]
MNELDELVRLHLDDPDTLTDEQLRTLASEFRQNPAIAERLKDHLILSEALARQFAENRQRFVEQVNQRIRSEIGVVGSQNNTSASQDSLTSSNTNLNSSGRRTLVLFALFSVVWAGCLTWLETTPWARKIAVVQSVQGPAFLERSGQEVRLLTGMPLIAGDQIETLEDSTATIEFPDKSKFTFSAGTIASLQSGSNVTEGILLEQGQLFAEIPSGNSERRIRCATPQGSVAALGARLVLTHDQGQTIVQVESGNVSVSRVDSIGEAVELVGGQIANIGPQGMELDAGEWPSNSDGVVFVLPPNAAQSNTPEQGFQLFATGPAGPFPLRPRRTARFNDAGEMVFDNGAFLADQSAGEAISRALESSQTLTIELTIQPAEISQGAAGTVLSLSQDDGSTRFAIRQQDDTLGLVVAGPPAETRFLFQFADTEPQHVVVILSPNRLRCFVAGELISDHQDVAIDFAKRPAEFLVFGDDWLGDSPWRGSLEGVAFYARGLTVEEIRRNRSHYRLQREPNPTAEPN